MLSFVIDFVLIFYFGMCVNRERGIERKANKKKKNNDKKYKSAVLADAGETQLSLREPPLKEKTYFTEMLK